MDTLVTLKRGICLLGLIASGAMSASAYSQNTEFGRGYEQGYRDGVAAAQQETRYQREGSYQDGAQYQQGRKFEQGRRARQIVVIEALYGVQNAICDAREPIQRAAEGQTRIDIPVNNTLCGDPAVGRTKQFYVTYQCGNGRAKREVKNEGDTVSLQCR